MSKKKTNETIARLDRVAARLGLEVRKRGANVREIDYNDRIIKYQPGGKGVLKVQSLVACSGEGWVLDATAHRSLESMERLLVSVSGRTSCKGPARQ